MRKYSFIGALLFMGCISQPELGELVQDMVVQTNYVPDIVYTDYGTYTMPLDTIGLISNASQATAIVNTYSKLITAAVKKNMDATNRQRVDLNQAPDLGVNIYVVNDVSIFQSVTYPGYYGYPGYSYGGYGYRGYYGYPYVNTYATSTAILIIELADLKNVNPQTSQPQTIWIANIGDLVTSVDQDVKVVEAIDQAFKQSGYLKK
jgi:Domain of unknown function (DUF4136)